MFLSSGILHILSCFQYLMGGVLSPILFTVYINDLLLHLEKAGIGCHWNHHYVGAACYADDIVLHCLLCVTCFKLALILPNLTIYLLMLLRLNSLNSQCVPLQVLQSLFSVVLNSFCMSLFGSALWVLSSSELKIP